MVDDSAITNFVIGRQWKQIPWESIHKIEKFRIYDSLFSRHRNVFLVSSGGLRIQFNDWISDLPSLLATINSCIAKYRIPTYAVDRGRDSLRKISLSTTDNAVRKRLLRDGARTQVSQL